MFDKVIDADRRGIIDDRFYAQLLDFFYCFIPVRHPYLEARLSVKCEFQLILAFE
jgi:hypothetical protein